MLHGCLWSAAWNSSSQLPFLSQKPWGISTPWNPSTQSLFIPPTSIPTLLQTLHQIPSDYRTPPCPFSPLLPPMRPSHSPFSDSSAGLIIQHITCSCCFSSFPLPLQNSEHFGSMPLPPHHSHRSPAHTANTLLCNTASLHLPLFRDNTSKPGLWPNHPFSK